MKFSGIVKDSKTKKALKGVEIELRIAGEEWAKVSTNSKGKYFIEKYGKYEEHFGKTLVVKAKKEGYKPYTPRPITINKTDFSFPIELTGLPLELKFEPIDKEGDSLDDVEVAFKTIRHRNCQRPFKKRNG